MYIAIKSRFSNTDCPYAKTEEFLLNIKKPQARPAAQCLMLIARNEAGGVLVRVSVWDLSGTPLMHDLSAALPEFYTTQSYRFCRITTGSDLEFQIQSRLGPESQSNWVNVVLTTSVLWCYWGTLNCHLGWGKL